MEECGEEVWVGGGVDEVDKVVRGKGVVVIYLESIGFY